MANRRSHILKASPIASSCDNREVVARNGADDLNSVAANSPQQLSFSIKSTCRVTDVKRSKVCALIADGTIPARKLGSRTLILRDDLLAFLQSLPLSRSGGRDDV